MFEFHKIEEEEEEEEVCPTKYNEPNPFMN